MKPMDRPKIVYVEWLDSAGTSGWVRQDDILECSPAVCCTVGFLVRQTKTELVLALNYNTAPATSTRFGDVMAIPIKVIVSTRRIN